MKRKEQPGRQWVKKKGTFSLHIFPGVWLHHKQQSNSLLAFTASSAVLDTLVCYGRGGRIGRGGLESIEPCPCPCPYIE